MILRFPEGGLGLSVDGHNVSNVFIVFVVVFILIFLQDECRSDINRWIGAPRPGVPSSPTAPEVSLHILEG